MNRWRRTLHALLAGLGSIVDLFGEPDVSRLRAVGYRTDEEAFAADRRAIAGDWQRAVARLEEERNG